MKNKRVALIISQFNWPVVEKLYEACSSELHRLGLLVQEQDVFYVPGAVEIPFVAKKLMKTTRYDGLITLGAVIRGETPHFDYVCQAVVDGVNAINLQGEIPCIFGVLTVDTPRQAWDRVLGLENKGAEFAQTVHAMMELNEKF